MSSEDVTLARVSARMSPGKWWGFNGVNTLEVRNGLFIHSSYVLFHGYLSRIYELTDIAVEAHSVIERRGRKWSTLTLKMPTSSRHFTGFPFDSEPLIAELVRSTRNR